jgi:WD40 repeat protein
MSIQRSHVLAAVAAIVLAPLWFVQRQALAEPIAIAEVQHQGDVDFEKEVLPIFRRNCLACHSATEAESDLVLETPQTILKGGSEGPAVVAGKSAESLLLKMASRQKEPYMPPPDNDVKAKPLTPQDLGLIKLWIDQGAKGDVKSASSMITWQPLPPGINPIYSVAITADGQYAAASRANQIFLYHVPSKRELGRLTDPSLIEKGIYKQPGVADLDLIQSLKFRPDGQWLASGGFRTVKLWHKPAGGKRLDLAALEGPPRSITVSADSKFAAIGEETGKVKVFDLTNGQIAKTLAGHSGPVTGVAFTADGARLVTGSLDKTFRVFNLADQQQIASVETASPINAVAIVGEGKLVATAGADNMLRTWDLPAMQPAEAPKPVKEIGGHGGPINSLLALAPNGAKVLTGCQDGGIRVVDVASGNIDKQMNHGAPVIAAAARADLKRIASIGANNSAKLWADNGQQLTEQKGDFRAALKLAETQRTSALAKKHVELAKADLKEAEDRKKAEEENQKKSGEALTKADGEFKQKDEALKAPKAEKEAADKALVDATAAKTKADETKKAMDEAFTKADEAQKKTKTEQDAAAKVAVDAAAVKTKADEAKKVTDDAFTKADEAQKKAKTDQDNATKVATDAATAKTKADEAKKVTDDAFAKADEAQKKAKTDQDNAIKAVTDAATAKTKADDAKKVTDDAFTKADEALKKAKTDHDNAAKAATDAAALAKTAADKLAAAKEAAAKDPNSQALKDAQAAAEKESTDAAAKKKVSDDAKVAADKAFTDAEAARKVAETNKAAADKAVVDADANKKKADEAKVAADKVFTDAETARKTAETNKANADKVATDADAAKKKADEAKVAADKAYVDAEAARKTAETNKAATDKVVVDADAKKKVADDAKAVADKAFTDADTVRKTAETNKQAADKGAADAVTALNQADQKVKQVTPNFQKATDERTAAERTLQTAQRGVERAADAVKKATEAVPGVDAKVKTAESTAQQRDQEVQAATAAAPTTEKPLKGIAFAPDGTTFAAVGDDQLLHTYSAETGAPVEVYSALAAPINVIAFAADGSAITAAANNTGVVWDFATEWKLARTIGSPDMATEFTDRVTALDFSPDGKLLAVGSGEPSRSGEIKIYSTENGQLVLAIKEPHSDTVNCLDFSPDGQQLASCAADRFVKVWNVADGKFVRSYEGHTHHVLGVTWRADGRMLATSGADMVIKIWDTRTGDQLRTVQNQFNKEVTSVQFVGDTDVVVATGGDNRVRFVNASNGGIARDFGGTADYMYAGAASDDGKTILAGGLDSVLRVWNDQGAEFAKFAAPAPPPQTAAK